MRNFINKLIAITFVLCITSLAAQSSLHKEYDYKAIDSYIVNHHTHDATNNCINVLYSSNDCENCILFLRQTLGEISSDSSITVNVITDNMSYAKKNLSKYKLNYSYYFDKEVFNLFEINKRTLLYSRFSGIFNDNTTQIIQNSGLSQTQSDTVFRHLDTIVMANDIETRVMPHNAFITVNPKMDVALLFKKSKLDGIENSYEVKYLYKHLKDSLKIYNLKERNPDPEHLKLLPFKDYGSLAKKNSINFYKIHSVTSYSNKLYCTFTISRLYKDIRQKDTYSLVSNSFIAQKEIKTEKDLNDAMRLDTYDNIYFADMFKFEDNIYPMSTWIYSTPDLIGDNTILSNINKLVPETNELEFAGKAKIVLDPRTKEAKIISIDKNNPNVRTRKNSFTIGKYLYKLKKDVSDESRNMGYITLTRDLIKS